ncbi:hypothetical protein BDA96_01G025900 [Sorghum bicolor]|uniref:Uncharacterized protein n=2 Tax=Sorghum bicolor TaxID=4558 RepID=A0A921RWK6_SORBI|nr:cell number regulator 10 [Sorghum bicolor]KAG0546810.1 hypothetical protein BDA96_01G025900 [Sorghum bicolor]|eukprot:XP_002463578.2 cell number regulator 10 [Sorghum bicolor]
MYPAKPCAPAGMAAAPVVGFPVAGALRQQWSSGLFDCLDDCHICCLTYWCPCITFGRIAEMVDRGATSCGTSGALYAVIACLTASQCTWVYSCTYRAMMRAQFGLPEAPCADCLVHLCCEPCALCQQYRELTARGLDPVHGWDFNAAMYPPPTQGMRRR